MSTPHFEIRQINPARSRWVWLFAALIWLGTLVLTVAATSLFLAKSVKQEPVAVSVDHMDVEALKMRIAVLERSEQVAKAALGDLQKTLRDREEEIAGVRADLAFYGRLVGGAKREGLAVHALRLTPVTDSRAWNFAATLTQNFKRGAETAGRLTLSVTGIVNGKIDTVDWKSLSQESESAGIGYAFKYFQQVNGIIMLPDGFEPNSVRVSAEGAGGRSVQEFSWEDAAKAEESGNVRE
ncbi:DUF6776 family protein [Dokdonella sp.]|uniref:DUF6776 family protein n=1 Tax=Dokdonella sp. TaxID=2291710 RepID=UPI003C581098